MKVVLTYPTSSGSQKFEMSGDSLTIGRGAVDLRVDDESMSRHHATIHRAGEKIWILDEGSTNGTFVNGAEVSPTGTPLKNGDAVRIGDNTTFKLSFQTEDAPQAGVFGNANANNAPKAKTATANTEGFGIMPIIVTAVSILLITLVGAGIGASVLLKPKEKPVIKDEFAENSDETGKKTNSVKTKVEGEDSRPTLKKSGSNGSTETSPVAPVSTNPTTGGTSVTDSPIGSPVSTAPVNIPLGKTYQQMSDDERRKFIQVEGQKIARVIGNSDGEALPPAIVGAIKGFLDGYSRRLRSARVNDCTKSGWLKSDLQSLLERASKNAHFINEAFSAQEVPRQIGLYLAMIESEHCNCLQSSTGPLGMFQFTFATAQGYYQPSDRVVKGATPANPDIRCEPEPSAKGAARYMKMLIARYGEGPRSFPLAIASYNSGEGALNKNLQEALNAARSEERSFWTMIDKADTLSNKYAIQFQRENQKYVPKFFAAAIIGENPPAFGVQLQPLSSITK